MKDIPDFWPDPCKYTFAGTHVVNYRYGSHLHEWLWSQAVCIWSKEKSSGGSEGFDSATPESTWPPKQRIIRKLNCTTNLENSYPNDCWDAFTDCRTHCCYPHSPNEQRQAISIKTPAGFFKTPTSWLMSKTNVNHYSRRPHRLNENGPDSVIN